MQHDHTMNDHKQETSSRLNMEMRDQDEVSINRVVVSSQSWVVRMLRASFSVLTIVTILPKDVASSDFECGINRFNNESPLTERIVGGNNSLQ